MREECHKARRRPQGAALATGADDRPAGANQAFCGEAFARELRVKSPAQMGRIPGRPACVARQPFTASCSSRLDRLFDLKDHFDLDRDVEG